MQGLPTSDEWIVAHTGIRERRIAAGHQATSDLAVLAAQRALKVAGVQAREIDFIICATSSPDHLLPATANIIQHQLGCNAGGFDLNAGCSGFVHALTTGFALQATGRFRHTLVIAADTYSRFLDWKDRSTAVFFGDGAAAAVLGPSDDDSWLRGACESSQGALAREITIPAGGSRLSVADATLAETRFQMNGRGVWDFVVSSIPLAIERVVAAAGIRLSDIALVVPHQANKRLLLACAERVGLAPDRFFLNVDCYANTAAASVGIALADACQRGRVQAGDYVLLIGFGAGLGWAGACIRWGRPHPSTRG